jgi:hypothetical protein
MQKEREAEDLSAAEHALLVQAAESRPLPEGVFFNGSKYVNWEGETLKQHPCLAQVVQEYLDTERLGMLLPLAAPPRSLPLARVRA